MSIINAGISVPTKYHQRHLGTKSTLDINLHVALVSQERYFPVSVTMRDSQIKNLNPVSADTDTGLMIIKLAFCEEHSILIVISTECLIYFVMPVFTLLSRLKSKSNVLNPNIWTLVDNKVTKSSNSTLSPNKL